MNYVVMKKSKKWLLCGLAMSSAVVFMDSTILPVALPTIQKSCALSQEGLQWSINVYLLAIACLVLVGGKLADFLGHRKMFCMGMGLFGLFSILGGCSYNQTSLILSRMFQGVSAALMLPSSMAILADTFAERERGRAIGFLVGLGSIFLSLGPVVGGLFTEYLSWRWIFWINIPVILTGIYIVLISIPRSVRSRERFDIPGCLCFMAALICLILALMQAREWGWGSKWVLLLFALSAGLGLLLVYLLKDTDHPFIDYHLFKNTSFMGGNLLVLCTQFLVMMSVYWVIYFQTSLGYTPLQAGGLLLVSTLPVMFGAPLSGFCADYFGVRVPILIGFICTLVALVTWMLFGSYLPFLIGSLFLFGSGIALMMTSIGTMILGAVPANKKGVGMGIYSTIRHTAAPLGVAVLGSIMSNASFFIFQQRGVQDPALQGIDFDYYATILASGRPLSAHIEHLSSDKMRALQQLFAGATQTALFWANLLCACISLVGLVICIVYLWKPKKQNSLKSHK